MNHPGMIALRALSPEELARQYHEVGSWKKVAQAYGVCARSAWEVGIEKGIRSSRSWRRVRELPDSAMRRRAGRSPYQVKAETVFRYRKAYTCRDLTRTGISGEELERKLEDILSGRMACYATELDRILLEEP